MRTELKRRVVNPSPMNVANNSVKVASRAVVGSLVSVASRCWRPTIRPANGELVRSDSWVAGSAESDKAIPVPCDGRFGSTH